MKLTPTICGNKRIYFPKRTLCDECEPTPITPPDYIRITTLPSKLQYADGDDISIEGIEVRAYYEDGSEWGDVPVNELTWEPIIAQSAGDEYTDGHGVNALRLSCYTVYDDYASRPYIRSDVIGKTSREHTAPPYDNVYVGTEVESTILITRYNGYVYVKLMSDTSTRVRPVYQAQYHESFYYYGNYNFPAIDIGQFVRQWTFPTYADLECRIPVSTSDPTHAGEMRSNNSITVSWDRGDGELLTDDYEIAVGGESDIWTDGDGLNAMRIQYTKIEKNRSLLL